MCSWIPYFYLVRIVGQLGGYGPVVSSDLEGASFGRWTMRYRQSARVVSSFQLSPRSTRTMEAKVKAMTPTADSTSPRWLQ